MDRCAVFVDAGYLHESAKTLMLNGHPGATVRPNSIALVREIAELAVQQTELPLLRIYWYAAAPNRNPYPDQRELASLGDIKLRLGNLRERAGGRMVQKGVDAELHADMTGLARNRGAVDFVLLSGDEDLLRAVDEVQSYGVRVHLWGVEAGPDGGNQSLELIAAADRRYVLQEAWIRNVFTILEPPKPDSPTARPPGEPGHATAAGAHAAVVPLRPGSARPNGAPPLHRSPEHVGAPPSPPHAAPQTPPPPGAEPPEPATPAASAGHTPAATTATTARTGPKPTDVRSRPLPARPVGADTLLYTSSGVHSGFNLVPDYRFYRLSDLTTQAEQFADAAEDTGIAYDADGVGRAYARRWLSRATSEAAALLAGEHPAIPRAIDAELLRYAVARGVDTWSSEAAKVAVRHGFWSAVQDQFAERPPREGDA